MTSASATAARPSPQYTPETPPHVAKGVAALQQHLAHHGPDLLRHVCSTVLKGAAADTALVNSVLLLLASSYGPYARESFVARVLRDEIATTLAWEGARAPFFATDTPGTRLLAGLYRAEGARWLSDMLVPLHTDAAALAQPKQDSRDAKSEFVALARTFLQRLWASGPQFPPVVARVLEQAAVMAESVVPSQSGHGMLVLVPLVVLRCLVPALAAPQQFGVTTAQPNAAVRTFLSHLARVLQDAAKKLLMSVSADAAADSDAGAEAEAAAASAEYTELVAAQVAPMEGFLKAVRAASKTDDNLALSKQQAALSTKSAEIEHALLVTYCAIEANAGEIEAGTREPAVLGALYEVLKAAPRDSGLLALPPMNTHDPLLVAAHKELDEFLLSFRATLLAASSGSKVMNSIAASTEQLKKQLEHEKQQCTALRANIAFMKARVEALVEQITRDTGKPPPQELFADAPEYAPSPAAAEPDASPALHTVPLSAHTTTPHAASSLPSQTPLAGAFHPAALRAGAATSHSSPLQTPAQRTSPLTRSQPMLALTRPVGGSASPPTGTALPPGAQHMHAAHTPRLQDEQARARTRADLMRCQACVDRLAELLECAQTPQQVLAIANVERELSRVQTTPLEQPFVFQSVGELENDVRSVATLTMGSSSIVRIRDLLPVMIDQTKRWLDELQKQEQTDAAMRARIEALTAFLIEVTGPANSVFASQQQQQQQPKEP